jgi:TPR repeat protein
MAAMSRLVLLLALVVGAAAPALADFDAGAAAVIKGDFATALAEFRPLAEHGHAKAQNNLGIMYQYGRGVAKDLAEAQRWYLKAAEQGIAQARYNLGLLYLGGEGVGRDPVQAYLWLSLAAEGGEETARDRLDRLGGDLTPEQLGEAQRRLREWRERHGGE